jgi:NAD+ kinase
MPARDGKRVLVVYKKSAYQTNVRERKNARFIELLERRDPAVERLIEAHADHAETIEETRAALEVMGARASFRFRGDEGLVEDVELVVTVGGDGTLLWASRWVGPGIPIMAINSAPRDSVGHFCAGTKGKVREALEAAFAGKLRRTELTRMEVELEGDVLSKRVLNDALFAHASPAATTRYLLEHRAGGERIVEEQKSSGIWVGPAAGSTAAQLSAGGQVLPIDSKSLQYVVREPYLRPEGSYRLTRGLVEAGDELVIRSKVREGRVFLDGPHHSHDVRMGARLVMRKSDEPLSLLGYPRASRA